MPKKDTGYSNNKYKRQAKDPEEREQTMIALSMDLVEYRLRNGTASSQETVHFLKLGSSKERLEQEGQSEQNKLLKAKTEKIRSEKNIDQLYTKAIAAMRSYAGIVEDIEDEDADTY